MKLKAVIGATLVFAVGYYIGGYNHETDIVKACDSFGNAGRVSWTDSLGICMRIDTDKKVDIIISH